MEPLPPEPISDVPFAGALAVFVPLLALVMIRFLLLHKYPTEEVKIELGFLCTFFTWVTGVTWLLFVDDSWAGYLYGLIFGAICFAVLGHFIWVLMRKRQQDKPLTSAAERITLFKEIRHRQ